MTAVIQTRQLTKRYKETLALDAVDLTLEENTIYGLLGRNGAGKTTLMSILTAQNFATSGTARVFGENPYENARVLQRICFVRESQKYPDDATAAHALRIARIFYPNWDQEFAARLIDDFQLPLKTRIKKLSRGQLSAVGVIIGLASRAEITFFDEPYLGLDAVARQIFYDRLLDELLANGIEPFATLYHWDLPQPLQDRFGGWQSTDTSKAFADYSGYVAQHLSDRIRSFFTLNEVGRFVNFGYGYGIDAPGLKLPQAALNQIHHNVALAHGLSVQAIRSHGRAGTRVGPAENIAACLPAIDTPENVRAAEIATRELNAGFLNVILTGEYTEAFLAYAGKDAPKYTAAELKIIGSPVDFVGLNIYSPQFYVVANDRAPGFDLLPIPASFPHMLSDWLRIAPETAYWVPRLAAKVWKLDTIYITENGTSSTDKRAPDGKVYDLDRIMYLRNYLMQLQRATTDGVPVRGYFLWSLMDNFEWIFGFEQRFGLYHVDFDTLVRTPKLSVQFYRDVVARNAIGA